MTDDSVDRQLGLLLRAQERPADEDFAARIERMVTIEARLDSARRAAWRRFAAETAAAAAVLLVFVVMARGAPAGDSARIVPPFSAAGAALLLLALWVAVCSRPGSGARAANPY